ncbi:hypothetical protein OKW21_004976 [Catalinimonas alkaloidigena]|uniref:DUF6588 family protein n=1 Tax=Catalinimonas alkaloidigena TaxID=1075417 RepID=UPI002405FFAE|nr:DUF6588 family protein [Catalinimonas alkaloidigena]MDF9799713.1 hypothetical protein [Catalinimonas alkaloidigena]
MKKSVLLLFIGSLLPGIGFTQSEVSFFILSGRENAHKLANAYFNPLGKSMYNNLGNGWMQGGAMLNAGQVQLRLQASATFFPAEDQQFDLSALGLSQHVAVAEGEAILTPTAIGDHINGVVLEVKAESPADGEEIPLATFSTPDGMGVPLLPMASAQLNVGVPYKTELMLRALPKVNFSAGDTDYTNSLWGLGIRHVLSQWLSEETLPFDIIIALAYGQQDAKGKPKIIGSWPHTNGQEIERTPEQQAQQIYNSQELHIAVGAWSTELLLSKKLSSFTLYTGFNYTTGVMEVISEGIYPRLDVRSSTEAPYYAYFFHDEEDPLKLRTSSAQLSFTSGAAYQLGILSLKLEGSLGRYKNITAGLGVNILR